MGQIIMDNQKIVSISQPLNSAFTAKVVAVRGECIDLKSNGQIIVAKKAFSCLIEPMVDDTAMLNYDECQQAYIIAILHRNNDAEATMKVPSNTTITCSNQLTIQSNEKTALVSKSIHEISDNLIMDGKTTTMNFDQGLIKGKKLHGHIQALTFVADLISASARQAMNKFVSYVRKTEQMDQIQAGQMGRKVDGLYNLNSKHTILVSSKETKIDGEHIHMG